MGQEAWRIRKIKRRIARSARSMAGKKVSLVIGGGIFREGRVVLRTCASLRKPVKNARGFLSPRPGNVPLRGRPGSSFLILLRKRGDAAPEKRKRPFSVP